MSTLTAWRAPWPTCQLSLSDAMRSRWYAVLLESCGLLRALAAADDFEQALLDVALAGTANALSEQVVQGLAARGPDGGSRFDVAETGWPRQPETCIPGSRYDDGMVVIRGRLTPRGRRGGAAGAERRQARRRAARRQASGLRHESDPVDEAGRMGGIQQFRPTAGRCRWAQVAECSPERAGLVPRHVGRPLSGRCCTCDSDTLTRRCGRSSTGYFHSRWYARRPDGWCRAATHASAAPCPGPRRPVAVGGQAALEEAGGIRVSRRQSARTPGLRRRHRRDAARPRRTVHWTSAARPASISHGPAPGAGGPRPATARFPELSGPKFATRITCGTGPYGGATALDNLVFSAGGITGRCTRKGSRSPATQLGAVRFVRPDGRTLPTRRLRSDWHGAPLEPTAHKFSDRGGSHD